MDRINIVLACAAGASTSILVRKVIEAGQAKGYDKIATTSKEADVILIGPQARYFVEKVNQLVPNTPCAVIAYQDYGMMNGEKVFQLAVDLLKGEKNV